MAVFKNNSLRISIIDRCLRNRRGYSTQEIFDKCNAALERRNEKTISSLNTIRNDFTAIANRWNIDIEDVRSGREIRYRYADPHFSIYNTPLNEDEIAQLSQSVSLLQRFEGMPGFEWVEEMSAHLQTTVSASPEPVIGFDENRQLKGMFFFSPLFKHITSKQTIRISYRSYKSGKLIEAVAHPYYLKEYNKRWFLLALNDEYKNLSIFALDRIETIERATVKYIPNTTIDFAHYFDHVVGVSINQNEPVQTVQIWVEKEQLPYTLSKPIHPSQRMVEKREDGSGVIEIEVIPNFELEQTLLAFGERIEVLSPQPLREKILSRIKNNLQKYQ